MYTLVLYIKIQEGAVMIRTQVYLNKNEKLALEKISRKTGMSQSALIRLAIDELIGKHQPQNRLLSLQQARGMWESRNDLPNFAQLRREMDRLGLTEEK